MSLTTAKIPEVGQIGVHHDKRAMAGGGGDKRKLQLVGSLLSMVRGLSLVLCRLLIPVLVRAFVKLLELTGIRRRDTKLQVEDKRPSVSTQSQSNKLPASSVPQTMETPRSRAFLPIQMSQKVVAGFEEQQVAHELSAQVVEEALRAIVDQLEKEAEAIMAAAAAAVVANGGEVQVGDQGELQEFTGNETSRDKITGKSQESSSASGKDEEELDVSFGESLASSSSRDSDECAGQQASEITLRRLKLSAREDVLVCGQNRHSTELARQLFAQLSSSRASRLEPLPGIEISSVASRRHARAAGQRGSSLSSRSSCCDDEQEHEENNNNNGSSSQADRRAHETHIDYLEELLGLRSSSSGPANRDSPLEPDNSSGTIKLDRRCCSSSSSSSGNFGRTLVCSVSPTSQMRVSPEGAGDEDLYPINGDEIRQCRAAFRENRRLIERVQDEACRRQQRQDAHSTGGLNRSSSQGAFQADETRHDHRVVDKSHWANSLGRRTRLPECSRCGLKLYPLDKMELDFTRTTLNIHRNCFRCQVCSTLLRLETYASIDGKLYCPAHVRCISLSR